MNSVAVLTPTYNHPKELMRLYQSLINQTNHNFTWIIVDDGSEADTEAILKVIKEGGYINLLVYRQENKGKGKAINSGFDLVDRDCKFVIIIDDDEELYTDAIETIYSYVNQYENSECGVICFSQRNEDGRILANPFINRDFYMSFQEHKENGLDAEPYIGYFTNKLGNQRFDVFKGEKYIAPSTLIMKVTMDSSLLWSKAVLGRTKYLPGGLTAQGRKLRLQCPLGGIEYCKLLQRNGAGLKTRIKYSILCYAYYDFVSDEMKEEINFGGIIKFTKILGIVIARYWRWKFFGGGIF